MLKNDKYNKFFKNFSKIFFELTNFKIILIVYVFIVLLCSLLLFLPFSQQPGVNVSFIDSLFITSSAFSDTGLTTVTTATSWSIWGQIIIAFLIFIGGVGIFSLKFYIFNIIFRKKTSLDTRNIIDKERAAKNIGISMKTISVAITVIVVFVILSSFVLFFPFYFTKPNIPVGQENQYVNPYGDVGLSIRFAIFHSISAINNAGFDLIGPTSLSPYYSDYLLQTIFLILLIIGGIGYPVIYDVYSFFRERFLGHNKKFSFSLFTKISTSSYFIISAVGLIFTFSFELNSQISNLGGDVIPFWKNSDFGNNFQKSFAIIFNTFSTRNAGFATVDLNYFSQPTLVIYAIMMFIGSAPSSTAGGIRTTTIAIIVMNVFRVIKNTDNVRLFKRKISNQTVLGANTVLIVSIFLVLISTFIVLSSTTLFNNDGIKKDFFDVLFEVSSAFGTTGLSLGVTSGLDVLSKIWLSLLMFIGQFGISASLLVWGNKFKKNWKYDYIEESVAIG